MSDPIITLLLTLGIRSTYRGFRYLHRALQLCLKDENYLLSIYKLLYTDIAAEFHVSRDSVEHCIRTAIFYCWYHGNRDFLCEIAMYPLSRKPTNGEFIDILYHYLKFLEG
ncbi:MAG: sporulation initiation factor Spo0A C-terminal domain-containing protein [Eubacteriales bacterium]|nr:sporulation initiation factor Spo0A C-terminal domain-containing protein [Eubacteriales bacterium]